MPIRQSLTISRAVACAWLMALSAAVAPAAAASAESRAATAKDGATKDGTTKDGTTKDGATKDGGAKGNATGDAHDDEQAAPPPRSKKSKKSMSSETKVMPVEAREPAEPPATDRTTKAAAEMLSAPRSRSSSVETVRRALGVPERPAPVPLRAAYDQPAAHVERAPVPRPAAVTEPGPTPAASPVFSTQCRRTTWNEIAGLFDRWNGALATNDPDQVVANYTSDAVLLPTVSNVPRTSPAEIRDYFEHFLTTSPVGRIDRRIIKIRCNTASDMGLYTFTLHERDGNVREVAARYSFIYEYRNGNWLIAHHHSSAMPEPVAAVAAAPMAKH